MDFSKLPTDNLYKFVAIAGIVILSLAIIFPVRFAHDANLQSFAVSREIAVTNAEYEFWESQRLLLDDRRKKYDKLMEGLNDFDKVPAEKRTEDQKRAFDEYMKIINSEQQAISQKMEEHHRNSLEVDKKRNTTDIMVDEANYLATSARWLLVFGIAGAVAGLIVASVGFYLWWQCVQRHEDKILQYEATKHLPKLEPEAASTASPAPNPSTPPNGPV